MNSICIIHFQPVEFYPPCFNLLKILGSLDSMGHKIHLITSAPGIEKQIGIPGIQIHRITQMRWVSGRVLRLLFYIRFLIYSLYLLIRKNAGTVFYYETLSSVAPCIYKLLCKPSCRLFIHYHEYTSPNEYASGMIFNRLLHQLEIIIYRRASWVSHTNLDRMLLFKNDLGNYAPKHAFILPNYPPSSWSNPSPETNHGRKSRIGFVYIGALNSETMYFREMATFVALRPSICYWDIYSDNYTKEILEFLERMGAGNITFKGSIEYDDLPITLSAYNVGLVLYKGHIPNYIFNIPNKFFEYYVCGLDVWFPVQMSSISSLITQRTYPKVIPLKFDHLEDISLKELTDRRGLKYEKVEFNCERACQTLQNMLTYAPEV